MAMDCALTEAMHEIEEVHRCYDEQEQVIKDRDDFIAELLPVVDSEDDGDSNSGPTYNGDNDRGAVRDNGENPKEVPEGNAHQEQAPQLESMLEEVPQEGEPH
jgi:hypothetical protein